MSDALVIRHAHREPMPSELGENAASDFDENQVQISLEGFESTRKFGLSLLGKYDAICHSPVSRCKQTAQQLALSSGIPVVSELNFLSSKFFDQLLVANEIDKKIIVAEMLDGSGIGYDKNHLFEKMHFLLRRFQNFSDIKGRVIYVTHDWWISLFLSFHTPLYRQIGYDIWPDFLQGFSLCHKDRQIVYRDEPFSLPDAYPALIVRTQNMTSWPRPN